MKLAELDNYEGDDVLAHEQALPIDESSKDGRLCKLLVDYKAVERREWYPLRDTIRYAWTIGFYNPPNEEEGEWHIAGWDWEMDSWRDGIGTPIGWRPFEEE